MTSYLRTVQAMTTVIHKVKIRRRVSGLSPQCDFPHLFYIQHHNHPLFLCPLQSSTMKFSAALLVASLATTADAFSVNNGATARVGTELYARQPIMAGNWKVRRSGGNMMVHLVSRFSTHHLFTDEPSYRS